MGGRGGLRAVLDDNIAGERLANQTSDLLVLDNLWNLHLAGTLLVLALKGEDGAVGQLATQIGALVDSCLKEVLIPAADEIAMVTEA